MKSVAAGDRPKFENLSFTGSLFFLTQALILLVIFGGDALLTTLRPGWAPRHIWALLDSPIHAATGVLIAWPLAASYASRRKAVALLAAAGLASVLIDVDHFLAAGSLSLYSATHLDGRPFTHSLLFALVCGILAWKATRSRRTGFIVLLALAAHFTRDASGGGIPYLIWPFAFNRLPYSVYVALQPGFSMLAWALMAARTARLPAPQRPANHPSATAPLSPGFLLSPVPVIEQSQAEVIECPPRDA
jgi:membrane-bound metal-dependent hydrolase YbcI (DUF457 family)